MDKEKWEWVAEHLPCFLILDNRMLDLTGKGMFQRGVNHGWHCFDAPVICRYDVVLMGQYFVR